MQQQKVSKQQNFLSGAIVLVVANAIVKVIGALFKIPINNLIGADGMGIFSVAYNLYTALFVLSTAGLPVAVSKMVAEAKALGKWNEIHRIVKMAAAIFVTVGAIGSLILYFGDSWLVGVVGNSMAYYAVKAIAPAIFFVAISSVFRGYYQGLSNMYPTAFSQVIEAVCKLGFGFVLVIVLVKAGMDIQYVAAGAIVGVTIGTVFSALYLALIYRRRLKKDQKKAAYRQVVGKPVSNKTIAKRLVMIAIPVTIGSSVLSLTNLIDMAVVMNRLQDVGFSMEKANYLYGAYNMSLTLFNLPQTLITAISISIIPAIAAAFARKDYELGKKTIASSMKITVMLALPCAAGLAVLAKPILDLLYFKRADDVIIATPLLQILGLAVVFVAMVSLTNAILQSIGKAHLPVITMFIGGVVKLTTNYILVGNPAINIHGAPLGTTACYGTITVLNLILIAYHTHSLPNPIRTVFKPLIATAGMSAAAYGVNLVCAKIVGGKLACLVAILIAIVVYGVLLLVVGAWEKEDVLLLPKGEKIARKLKMK